MSTKKFLGLNDINSAKSHADKPSLGQSLMQQTRMWAREKLNESMLRQEELTHYVEALVNNKPQIREIVTLLNSPLPDVRKESYKAVTRMYAEFIRTISSTPAKKTPLYKRMTPKIFLLGLLTACGQPAPNTDMLALRQTLDSVNQSNGELKGALAGIQAKNEKLERMVENLQAGMNSSNTANKEADESTRKYIDETFKNYFGSLQSQLTELANAGKITKEQLDSTMAQVGSMQSALAGKADQAMVDGMSAYLTQVDSNVGGVGNALTEVQNQLGQMQNMLNTGTVNVSLEDTDQEVNEEEESTETTEES